MRAIGVDVGGTTIKIGVCHPDGTLTHSRQVPTPCGVGPLVALIAGEVARLRAEVAAEQGSQSALPVPAAQPAQSLPDAAGRLSDTVAVVVPGIVDERTGTAELSVNLDWRDVPMRALLAGALGCPVVFGHDVRAGALAESRVGAGRGSADMLFMPLGTGIAAALVLDGEAFIGRPWAGEVGQVLVADPGGRTRLTLERVASASGVEHRYLAQLAQHAQLDRRPDSLTADAPGPTEAGGSRMVFERARAGDSLAAAVIAEAVTALAEVLATVVALLGPLRIVVGGGMAAAGDYLLSPLRRAVADRLVLGQLPEIVQTTCGPWAGCIGAGLMALDATAPAHTPRSATPRSATSPDEEHGQP